MPDPAFANVDPGAGLRRLDGWVRGFRTDVSDLERDLPPPAGGGPPPRRPVPDPRSTTVAPVGIRSCAQAANGGRVAELADIVTKLLIPVAERDEARVHELLARYRETTLAP